MAELENLQNTNPLNSLEGYVSINQILYHCNPAFCMENFRGHFAFVTCPSFREEEFNREGAHLILIVIFCNVFDDQSKSYSILFAYKL